MLSVSEGTVVAGLLITSFLFLETISMPADFVAGVTLISLPLCNDYIQFFFC